MIWVSIVIVALMTAFAAFGIIDYVFLKNRFGLGNEFKKGFELIGPLCLAMTGIISSIPLLEVVIKNTISPLYEMIGLDPSMAVTAILAIDMGGYQLATKVALSEIIGQWAGLVYSSMMGATIIFSLPVGLASINKKDSPFFIKGVLFGIAAIPFGTFIGGIMMGVPVLAALLNLVPPIIFSIIIIVCLSLWPNGTVKVFKIFSIIINAFGFICLAIAMVKDLVLTPIAAETGAFVIEETPFINLFAPTSEGILAAGSIGLILAGALPFTAALKQLLKKPLRKLSEKTNGTDSGVSGYLLSSVNIMTLFTSLDKMKDKEKIYNVAFAICAAFMLGDHLAFVAAKATKYILPMIVSKLLSGIFAVLLAYLYLKLSDKKKENLYEKKRI